MKDNTLMSDAMLILPHMLTLDPQRAKARRLSAEPMAAQPVMEA
jgi:hypothetical protein